jgi:hypothetical protein
MGSLDFQCMIGAESTYGTGVTPTVGLEFDSEGFEETYGRTEGDPLRPGGYTLRSDRFTPYPDGAAGPLALGVLSKGFGLLFKHALGAISTGSLTDSTYTHTATMGPLYGKSLTVQVGRPLHPSGTVQPFTFAGGKITEWELANSVDERLMFTPTFDFQSATTATALATASYPTSMEELTWAGGVITIGGSSFDITEITISGNNGMNTDRKQIRGSTLKKEPTSHRREVTYSMTADFNSTAQRDRAVAATRAGALAAITATWTAPTLAGTTTYPALVVTIPAARFDTFSATAGGPDGITQSFGGAARYDGTNSPITFAYTTTDSTP